MKGRYHGRGGGHHRHHGRHGEERSMRRLLAHGDLRFVVLLLIAEKPRHGYELIKIIEVKSSGQYAPSPGVIYPTLTYLEEMGLIAAKTLDEKKQFSITKEGAAHLQENRGAATEILKRLEEMGASLARSSAQEGGEPFASADRSEMRMIFHSLRAELMELKRGPLKLKKDALEILKRALSELQNLRKAD